MIIFNFFDDFLFNLQERLNHISIDSKALFMDSMLFLLLYCSLPDIRISQPMESAGPLIVENEILAFWQ